MPLHNLEMNGRAERIPELPAAALLQMKYISKCNSGHVRWALLLGSVDTIFPLQRGSPNGTRRFTYRETVGEGRECEESEMCLCIETSNKNVNV